MVDGVGPVVRVAEDQVLLLAVDGLGNVLPDYVHVGLLKQILHDLHVVVVQGRGVLGGVDVEGDLAGTLVVQDGGAGVGPLEAILRLQGLHVRAGRFVTLFAATAAAGGQGEQHRGQHKSRNQFFHLRITSILFNCFCFPA